jgi:fatty-acyl-CoA synthase
MPLPSSLGALVDSAPPEYPALAHARGTLTYGMISAESACLAGGLASLGIAAGDRVGLWLRNQPEWLTLYLALARLGAIAVAINTRFRGAEVADIVERSGCRALAVNPSFRRIDFAGILEQADPAAFDRLETVILCAEGEERGDESARTLPHKRRITYAALAASAPLVEARGALASPSAIFTTSGTTKAPKFVLHTQRSIVAHANDVVDPFMLRRTSVLQALPLCGVFGFTQAMGALAGHSTLVLQPAWDAEEAALLLDRHRITVSNGTDAMVAGLLDVAGDAALARIPFSGYAAFDPALGDLVARAEARGLKLIGLYGMSEIQALFARRHEDEARSRRALAGGLPVSPLARVRVRNPDSGRLLGVNESGELEVSGPSLMKEYFGNEAATAAAMTEDGFVRTGDLGRLLDDGSFVFETRMGDVLRLSGFLVAPAEIEAFLQRHPAIEGAQVVGVSTPVGVKPVAFVTVRNGARFEEAAARSHCEAGLARYKVPARIIAVDAFPTTPSPNGIKIQKAKLRETAASILAGAA